MEIIYILFQLFNMLLSLQISKNVLVSNFPTKMSNFFCKRITNNKQIKMLISIDFMVINVSSKIYDENKKYNEKIKISLKKGKLLNC